MNTTCLRPGKAALTRLFLMLLLCISLVAGLFFSCTTVPKEIEEGLKPAEFFQRAQTAVVERNDFKTALQYYRTFLERFPDDIQNGVAAEYEIAFIYYKMKNFDEAKRLFGELVARYEGDAAMVLPRWPKVLSEKILAKIDAAENDQAKKEQAKKEQAPQSP